MEFSPARPEFPGGGNYTDIPQLFVDGDLSRFGALIVAVSVGAFLCLVSGLLCICCASRRNGPF
jgi:hypothetical protein